MSDQPSELPFKQLGESLKSLRQKLRESVAEVSGAVEIEAQTLERFEKGLQRPSEDILMLLINHFDLTEKEEANLWGLAGYAQPSEQEQSEPHSQTNNNRTMVMIMAVDPRIIYSDGAQVAANGSGVVVNFVQGMGTPQALVTARIGMSRNQAEALVRTLQQAMEGSKPRQLPASTTKPKPSTKSKSAKKQDQ